MSSELNEPAYLSQINDHPRDKDMVFIEKTHKYIITPDPDTPYTSVTTWNHSHFGHFNAAIIIKNMMKGKNWNPENKYWGLTAEEIKKKWSHDGQIAAALGTELHWKIECFMNLGGLRHQDLLYIYESNLKKEGAKECAKECAEEGDNCKEWTYFLDFVRATPDLKPYRTEWRIYDETNKLAGSIDMVYENDDGTLMIYDWKRCKEISKSCAFKKHAKTKCINYIPDTNFWHYSLQLHTYKSILESKYGKIVTDLYLVQLHEINSCFEVIKVADMTQELVKLYEFKRTSEQTSEQVVKIAPLPL